jgi:DNA-nicking Smr family endonuclease
MARKRKGGRKAPGSEGIAGEPDAGSFTLPRAPERLSSPFKEGLGDLKKRLAEQADRTKKAAAARPRSREPQELARTSVVTRSAPPGELRPARRTRAGMPEDEAVALSMAMQGVKPLDQTRASRVAAHTPRVATRTAQVAPFRDSAEEEARQRLEQLVASGVSFKIERERDFVSGLRKDAQPRVLRDLMRRVSAHSTLDLHGMTQPEAREAVASFVRKEARRGLDALCIVHGKGNHSEGGLGVLRDVVLAALTETAAAPHVLAFVTAPELLGGSGALLVQLTSR